MISTFQIIKTRKFALTMILALFTSHLIANDKLIEKVQNDIISFGFSIKTQNPGSKATVAGAKLIEAMYGENTRNPFCIITLEILDDQICLIQIIAMHESNAASICSNVTRSAAQKIFSYPFGIKNAEELLEAHESQKALSIIGLGKQTRKTINGKEFIGTWLFNPAYSKEIIQTLALAPCIKTPEAQP